MRILSRYFALRFLSLFIAILFVSTLAIIVVEMLLNFDDMVADEANLSGVLGYLFLRIPAYYLRDLIPIAVFASAFFAIGLGAHWLELTAANAGGIATLRIALPLLVVAAGLGSASFLLNESVVIDAAAGWNQKLGGESHPMSFRRGTFWYHRGRTIYNIAAANRDQQLLRGVTVFELSPEGRLLRSVHAQQANIADDPLWLLENATIRSFDPERRDAPPEFQRVAQTSLTLDESSGEELMNADTSSLTLRDLSRYIRERSLDSDAAPRERTLYHARLSEPLTVLTFALMALPLGLRVQRTRSLAQPAVYGVATVAIFFALRNTALTLAAEAVLPPAVGAWSVLLLFGMLGTWQLARVDAR